MLSLSRVSPQFLRYVVNGLLATAVHYGILSLAVSRLPLAWQANLMGACFGIAASFLGSRYFVFGPGQVPVWQQLRRFVLLYGAIGALHALVMAVLTDGAGWDYRVTFVLATALQTMLSFLGNKYLVFHS